MASPRNAVRTAALFALSSMGVSGFFAGQAKAAVITYNFDVNGATTGFGVVTATTYDWDATTNGGFWSNNGTSTTGNIATNGWVQANFPKFQPASTPTYTVDVSNDEQITGLFASTAQTLTIQQVGGTGSLDLVAGSDGFLGGGDVTLAIPIKGAGAPNPSNGGNMRFNASNSYTGGTLFSSSSTLVHFNNNNAFGTGVASIDVAAASVVPLLASGGATITLPNAFNNMISGSGVNFGSDANTPVVSTGQWTLGTNSLIIKNNTATSPVTISGKITGTTAALTLISTNGGTITLSGANTYTGATTIGNTGNALITVVLGASNTIATSTAMSLGGGTLNPDGLTQNMSSTTLAMSASSAISYVAGNAEVDFKNSSASAWTGTLNLTNWSNFTLLRFGTDSTGLTSAQLADIEFNGVAGTKGTAMLTAAGYVVPEPTTVAILLIGAPMLAARRRRRA